VDDFDTFWATYPRKEAKKDARKAWATLTDGQKFAARESIGIHVRYWNASGRTSQYIPLGGTWLRGERWEDELEMPETQKMEWWKSKEGIEAKAKETGCWPARANEGWHELKARILAKLKVAA
jgi:hypothetical protein